MKRRKRIARQAKKVGRIAKAGFLFAKRQAGATVGAVRATAEKYQRTQKRVWGWSERTGYGQQSVADLLGFREKKKEKKD